MLPQEIRKQKPRCVSEPIFWGQDVPPVPIRHLKHREFPLSARRRRPGSAPERKVNCVLVGDGAVGKTSLIVSYTTNGYPTEYVPTAFDNFTVMVVVDGKPVRLQLWDTAGHDELDLLRPLCYKNADVFLLVYSVVRPSSLRSLVDHWLPEIRHQCPDTPLVLVGTQLDLREDVQVLIQLAQNQQRPVGTEEGRQLAEELGMVGFMEVSALTQKNLKDPFDSAILASIQQTEMESCSEERKMKMKIPLRTKTPDKMKSVWETWWRKINCVMVEQSCEVK
ncbi:hypothetical protein OYC64_016309 [Pagothenia borchgrevinki]|uniref:Uncharacterized protein n=1 Tax=Pagothenia borchgrevinki TaxID=8213 RepID=A0ABD2HIT5_PAGBO